MIRVLLADDHEVVRRGIRGLLSTQHRLRVVGEAENGRKAVEMSKQLRPDLAIVDIEMPELSGLEVAREIRKSAPNTKVIILSMHESGEMLRKVLEAGALGFASKADLGHTLLKVVMAVSRGERGFTPRISEAMLSGFINQSKQLALRYELHSALTPRERDTIRLIADGKSNKEVAEAIHVTVKTVETYRERMMRKLDMHSVSELVRYAIRTGLIEA